MKGIIGMVTAIVVVSVAAALLFVPGLKESLLSLNSADTYCQDAPYNPNCICTLDRIKIWSWNKFKYDCITESPSSTLDCSWCGGQCVEWQKIWQQYPTVESYNEYCGSREPVPGMACLAQLNSESHLECVAVPAYNQEGLITFCSKEALAEFVTEYEGSNEELVQFLRSGCPTPGVNPFDGCELQFNGAAVAGHNQSGATTSFAECISNCYDQQGNLVGGHVIWEVMWYPEYSPRVLAFPPSAGSYSSDCISGL